MEITVVDSDHTGTGLQRSIDLIMSMGFHQCFQIEFANRDQQVSKLSWLKHSNNQQHRTGASQTGLKQLIAVKDKIFSQ